MTRAFFLVLVLVSLTACKGNTSPTAPTASVPYSQTDLRVGTGAEAITGRRLMVAYTGWLYDASANQNKGRQFDSNPAFSFTLGTGVIAGWNQGIAGMRVGGMRRLVLPPNLAYGSAGAGNGAIPPNATLVFDVELLSVQ